jgi:hypothetical protein
VIAHGPFAGRATDLDHARPEHDPRAAERSVVRRESGPAIDHRCAVSGLGRHRWPGSNPVVLERRVAIEELGAHLFEPPGDTVRRIGTQIGTQIGTWRIGMRSVGRARGARRRPSSVSA